MSGSMFIIKEYLEKYIRRNRHALYRILKFQKKRSFFINSVRLRRFHLYINSAFDDFLIYFSSLITCSSLQLIIWEVNWIVRYLTNCFDKHAKSFCSICNSFHLFNFPSCTYFFNYLFSIRIGIFPSYKFPILDLQSRYLWQNIFVYLFNSKLLLHFSLKTIQLQRKKVLLE